MFGNFTFGKGRFGDPGFAPTSGATTCTLDATLGELLCDAQAKVAAKGQGAGGIKPVKLPWVHVKREPEKPPRILAALSARLGDLTLAAEAIVSPPDRHAEMWAELGGVSCSASSRVLAICETESVLCSLSCECFAGAQASATMNADLSGHDDWSEEMEILELLAIGRL